MLRQDFLSKFSILSFAYFLPAFSGDTLYSTSLGTSRVLRNSIAWYRTSEERSYAEQAQGISKVSCNLGWEDKLMWCLRRLALTASSSALFLLLQLLQASAVAFNSYELEKLKLLGLLLLYIFLLSFFYFLEQEMAIALYSRGAFLVAGKDTECGGERKVKPFFLLMEFGLAEAWRFTVLGQKAYWRGQRSIWEGPLRVEFQELSRLGKDGLQTSLSHFCVRCCKEDPEFLETEGSFLLPVWVGRGHAIHSCMGQP